MPWHQTPSQYWWRISGFIGNIKDQLSERLTYNKTWAVKFHGVDIYELHIVEIGESWHRGYELQEAFQTSPIEVREVKGVSVQAKQKRRYNSTPFVLSERKSCVKIVPLLLELDIIHAFLNPREWQ